MAEHRQKALAKPNLVATQTRFRNHLPGHVGPGVVHRELRRSILCFLASEIGMSINSRTKSTAIGSTCRRDTQANLKCVLTLQPQT